MEEKILSMPKAEKLKTANQNRTVNLLLRTVF